MVFIVVWKLFPWFSAGSREELLYIELYIHCVLRRLRVQCPMLPSWTHLRMLHFFFQKSSSHVLLHVSVMLHIQHWSHQVIMDYEQKVCMQCWTKRLDLMLNLLIALGSLNRRGSACCLPTCAHPRLGPRVDKGARGASWEVGVTVLWLKSYSGTDFNFVCINILNSSPQIYTF